MSFQCSTFSFLRTAKGHLVTWLGSDLKCYSFLFLNFIAETVKSVIYENVKA